MRVAWTQGCSAMVAAALALLLAAPLRAADGTGVRTVADELGSRVKTPEASEGASKGGLTDSAVRMWSTYALGAIPDEVRDRNGVMIKLDKSDPNKYLIPLDDTRQVIKVATRSAYAEACDLHDLEKANYETLMRGEEARKIWSEEQLLFISALHLFSTSYFAGRGQVTLEDIPAKDAAAAKAAPVETITSKKLTCPPEQKEKVTQAINAYVAAAAPPVIPSAPTAAAPAAPIPAPAAPQAGTAAPVAGGAN